MTRLSLDGKKASKGTPLADRIKMHVDISPSECWRWTGAISYKGYGRINMPPRGTNLRYAHRVSYETFIGPIPAGLHIDHLCGVRHCVNPAHLEAVTVKENNRRARFRETDSLADTG